MKALQELPQDYRAICAIDLQKNKKLALLVNGMALVIAALMVVPMHLTVSFATLFDMSRGMGAYFLRFGVLLVAIVAYMILHELVHGIVMKCCGTKQVKYGFTGVYAFAGSQDYYDKNDLYWLSKIIHAESEGEPFLGKIAVGNVVLNRVKDSYFPNTVYDVIFDRKNGVQFSPVANGTIHKEAGEDAVMAAKICLENYRISDKILYFLNEKLATNFWIVENCNLIMSIGGHDFYAP